MSLSEDEKEKARFLCGYYGSAGHPTCSVCGGYHFRDLPGDNGWKCRRLLAKKYGFWLVVSLLVLGVSEVVGNATYPSNGTQHYNAFVNLLCIVGFLGGLLAAIVMACFLCQAIFGRGQP